MVSKYKDRETKNTNANHKTGLKRKTKATVRTVKAVLITALLKGCGGVRAYPSCNGAAWTGL